MKIVFLTAGTGSYYCGACMRDQTLARELHRDGHDVTIAPLYLPLILDDEDGTVPRAPIFFGGISVYLQQKLGFFRHLPRGVLRLFNAPALLRWAARHSHMTSAREHGALTLDMLHLEQSKLGSEWDTLAAWLERERPDLVCLSNALLAGFIPLLQQRLQRPVLAFFQGEDAFLDGLPEPYRTQCWTALAERLAVADALVAPSRFYAELMRERLGLAPDTIQVAVNGVRLEAFPPRAGPPATPTIGYLARMSPEKGLEVLVDAFIVLARTLGDAETRLAIAGAMTAGDEPFVRRMQQRLVEVGLADRVTWTPNLSRDAKVAFLRGLTLFSVPAVYAEAFGLYVVEAMACGVPVVQPSASSFPEIVPVAGGGSLVAPKNAEALAREWRRLLQAPAEARRLGHAARTGVERLFSASTMRAQFCQIAEHVVQSSRAPTRTFNPSRHRAPVAG